VNAAAAPGGDGSLATPYAALSEVRWSSLAEGTTVALARGSYGGTLPLEAGIRVVGACVAETILTGAEIAVAAVVSVTTAGAPAELSNLSIVSAPEGGVDVHSGRALSLTGVLVERVMGFGASASEAGTTLTLRDVVIREMQLETSFGRAINVQGGASIDASNVIVERGPDVGIFVHGVGTRAVMTGLVVRDIADFGVEVVEGGSLESARMVVERTRELGVHLTGGGTEAVVEHLIVRDTEVRAAGAMGGHGIGILLGARLEASRALVERSQDVAVLVSDAGSTLVLTDAVVRDTSPQPSDGLRGRGIQAQLGARVEATRMLASGHRDTAIGATAADTEVVLRDVAVRDIASRESDLRFGYGASAHWTARISGERVSIDDVYEAGVVVTGDARAELSDVSITAVRASECACPDGIYGHGVVAADGAARLVRFAIADTDTCGLFVAQDPSTLGTPSLDVETGVVERTAIGACVQVDGYDLARLMRSVVYRSNMVNLDTTMLPVPPPEDPLGP
jgi:hypothetical protein